MAKPIQIIMEAKITKRSAFLAIFIQGPLKVHLGVAAVRSWPTTAGDPWSAIHQFRAVPQLLHGALMQAHFRQ